LQYSGVFWATFLPEAYLPDFDSWTKYTVNKLFLKSEIY
jgi:hypothetical protein